MLPKISDAEMEVLRILMELGEATAGQLYEACSRRKTWAPGTVVTFVRRLEKKRYVEHTVPDGKKAYVYRPKKEAFAAIRRAVGDLLERMFAGDPLPMVSHLLEERRFSRKQIAALRKLISDYERAGGLSDE